MMMTRTVLIFSISFQLTLQFLLIRGIVSTGVFRMSRIFTFIGIRDLFLLVLASVMNVYFLTGLVVRLFVLAYIGE